MPHPEAAASCLHPLSCPLLWDGGPQDTASVISVPDRRSLHAGPLHSLDAIIIIIITPMTAVQVLVVASPATDGSGHWRTCDH